MKRAEMLMICLGIFFGGQNLLGQAVGNNGDPRNPLPDWVQRVDEGRERMRRISGLDDRGMMIKNETYSRRVPLYKGEKQKSEH